MKFKKNIIFPKIRESNTESNKYNVSVRQSKFGNGLFSEKFISVGSIAFKFTGRYISFKDTLNLGVEECYPLQIGIDMYLYPDEPFKFFNHSCEPNCGIKDDLTVLLSKTSNQEMNYSSIILPLC